MLLLLGLCVLLVSMGGGAAESRPTMQALGNGHLGISVDAQGRVFSTRWPGVGHFEHLTAALRMYSLDTQLDTSYGAGWSLYDGEAYRLPDDYVIEANPVASELRARMFWREAEVVVQHTVFISAPEEGRPDVLVDQVDLLETGDNDDLELVWRYAFQPSIETIAELPGGLGMWSQSGDAGLLNWGRDASIFGYVPDPEDRFAWDRFVDEESPDQAGMERLGRGCWIVTYAEPAPASILRETAQGVATLDMGLIRPVAPLNLHFKLDSGVTTHTVYTLFGDNFAIIEAGKALLREMDTAGLLEEAQSFWNGLHEHREAQLDIPVASEAVLENQETLRQVARLGLAFHRDRVGNGVVAYQRQPMPNFSATPELGAWVAYAYAADRQYYESMGLIAFWGEQLRQEARRGAPAGSMPMAVYSNGVEAAPSFWLQTRGTAWWLGALRHVHRLLPEVEQNELLQANQEALMLAGDFLADRLHPASGEPVPEFDMAKRQDRRRIESDLLQYVGLLSAVELLEATDANAPALWRESLEDMETYLAFERLNQQEAWVLDSALPFWLDGLLPRTNRLWEAQVLSEGGWLPMQALVQRPMPELDDNLLYVLRSAPKQAAQVLLRWGGLALEKPSE